MCSLSGDNNRIRQIDLDGSAYTVTTLAGSGEAGSADGIAAEASFNWPTGVVVADANHLFVADHRNNLIRMIVLP